jgi:type II secretory pathway pseudopilin PulG
MKAVNLIPSDQRGGGGNVKGESDGGAFIVIGLLACLAVLALLYGVARHQVSSRTSEVASVTAQAQVTQARASQLAPYVSFKATYQTRLQAVSQLVGTRFDWAHAIHEIGRVLPKDAALNSVHGSIGSTKGSSSSSSPSSSSSASAAAGTVSSATPPGTVPVFTLAGCATTQSEVAVTLQRLRLIDGVSAVTLQSSTKSTAAGGGSGGCPKGDPTFAVQVDFAPLPTPSTPSAATPTASSTGAGATGAAETGTAATGAAAPGAAATPTSSRGGA